MSKDLLVGKTEVLFNKKKLLELLQSSPNSNVVAFAIKHYNTGSDVVTSYEVTACALNTVTCQMTAQGSPVLGYSPTPCPYPPGCDPTTSTAKAALISTCLRLEPNAVPNSPQ